MSSSGSRLCSCMATGRFYLLMICFNWTGSYKQRSCTLNCNLLGHAVRIVTYILFLLQPADKISAPNQKKKSSLMYTWMYVQKRDLCLPIFWRLCLIGFTFSQPFLVTRAIELASTPSSSKSNNSGYGLIGAYALVYIGIAVSPSLLFGSSLTARQDLEWSILSWNEQSSHNDERFSRSLHFREDSSSSILRCNFRCCFILDQYGY